MRRHDREIRDFDEIIDVIRRCTVCRVAFSGADYPYVVPLSFGYKTRGETLALYFHCAREGQKLDRMNHNNRVAFELDRPGPFVGGDTPCASTMAFESVCGTGRLSVVPAGGKTNSLAQIMRQYTGREDFIFDETALNAVVVLKLDVEEITGKRLQIDN